MCYLDHAAAAEAGLDEGLGDPPRGVRGGAVHLGEVLAGEGAAAVRAPAAVCVHDDLATGQASVRLTRKP